MIRSQLSVDSVSHPGSHAPLVAGDNNNCLWQKERAERTDIANREDIRKVIVNNNNAQASNLANKDRVNSYFIYGGTGSEIEKLKYKINNSNTKIFKQVSYKKIKKILLKMDILLLPYTKKVTVSGDVGNIYNFMSPMKMFDYLGYGKIILSSNVPVLREIIKNKKNAILIKNFLRLQSWLIEIKKLRYSYSSNIIISKNALKTGRSFK